MQSNVNAHRVRTALTALAVSATLTACAVGPKYERPGAPELANEVLAPAQGILSATITAAVSGRWLDSSWFT